MWSHSATFGAADFCDLLNHFLIVGLCIFCKSCFVMSCFGIKYCIVVFFVACLAYHNLQANHFPKDNGRTTREIWQTLKKIYVEFSIVCRSIIFTNPILVKFLVVSPNWMILTKITNACCGLKTFLSLKFDIEVPCVRRMVRRRLRGQVFEHLGVWNNHM